MKPERLSFQNLVALPCMRRLIRGYPADFRTEFEQEMLAAFQTQLEDPPSAGFKNAWQLTVFTLLDTLWSLGKENLEQRNRAMNKPSSLPIMFASILLAAWSVFWGWAVLSWMNSAIIPPDRLILGDQYSPLALAGVNGFMVFAPAAALLLLVAPIIRIETSTPEGDLLRLSLRRSNKGTITLVCLSALFSLGVFLLFGVLRHIL